MQILKLRVPINDLANEPAAWNDFQIEMSNMRERAEDKFFALASAAAPSMRATGCCWHWALPPRCVGPSWSGWIGSAKAPATDI